MGQFAAAYRRHFGGTESALQLYSGFTAFFAGVALGLAGILVVLSGDLLIASDHARHEAGIFTAALGMILLFMGLQLTLPSRLIIHAAAGIGALVCVVATALFLQAYPLDWGPRAANDGSRQVILLYTLGLVLLLTTTAMALVVNFVSRHMVLPGRELEDDIFADPDRPVSMEEVMRDIEREVARQKLTWGGIEGDRLPQQLLKLKADFGPGATVSQGRAGKVTETMANEMDIAYTALARLRGTEGREVSDEDDTSTAIEALKALRRARQVEMEASWWYRFKRWLVTLFTGKRSRAPAPRAARASRSPTAARTARGSASEAGRPARGTEGSEPGGLVRFEEIRTK